MDEQDSRCSEGRAALLGTPWLHAHPFPIPAAPTPLQGSSLPSPCPFLLHPGCSLPCQGTEQTFWFLGCNRSRLLGEFLPEATTA